MSVHPFRKHSVAAIVMNESDVPPPYIVADIRTGKRFSVPNKLPPVKDQRRVTLVRPCESFKEKKEKFNISFGYAALNAEYSGEGCSDDAGCSVFSIYTGDKHTHTVCQQPVGQQADVFIATLTEKHKSQLRKFLESTQRAENEYFVWIRDSTSNVVTVLSIKTLENHLKSKQHGVRRVKWRHLSTERLSIYRYSLPAITVEKSQQLRQCLSNHKKLCLLFTWLAFVVIICVTVILGSLNPEGYGNKNVTLPINASSPYETNYMGSINGRNVK